MIDWTRSPAQPAREEAEALLVELAHLIELAGHGPFTSRPVVAPDARHFPDPWASTPAGVRLVLRRLCWYAELELDVVVDDARRPRPSREGLVGSQLAFDRIAEGAARFELHELGNDEIVGIAAHEVGRAFVATLADGSHPFRTTAVDDDGAHPVDARRGSVAAVYLGLGVLAANAAHASRSWGKTVGEYGVSQTAIGTAGGVSAAGLSFLLAVQAIVRRERSAAIGDLHANQAADFEAWLDVLVGHDEALRLRLGIPARETWVPTTRPRARAFDHEAADLDADADALRLRQFNTGQRVYRVRHHRGLVHGGLGSVVATAAAGVGASLASGPIGICIAIGAAVGVGLGYAVGRRAIYWLCSDGQCQSYLSADATQCPVCGGTIAAEIQNAADRFDMDERLDRAAGGR